MATGIKCPRCSGTHIWKIGYVPTVAGRKDRYRCTECGHTFTGAVTPYAKKPAKKAPAKRQPSKKTPTKSCK